MRILLGCVVLAVVLGGVPVLAHHVGDGGAMISSFNPSASQLRPPQTFLGFSFMADHLDGGLGHLLSYQLAGEYSPHRRLGVGLRVPIISIRQQFLPETDGLGDLAISLKGLVKEWVPARIFLTLGTEVSFPTGSESRGTGDFMAAPYLTLAKELPWFSLVGTVGSSLAIADPIRPAADYASSLIVPVIKGAMPVDGLLTFQGSTILASSTFKASSTKAYLQPAISLHLQPRLIATVGGKFSVLDTLEVGPGVTLSRQSTAPLSDVDAQFIFNINYSF